MSDLPRKEHISTGMKVLVELKQDQGTGKLTSGVVKEILTPGDTHPYGIMVELEGGQKGRVKSLELTKVSSTQILQNNEISNIQIPKVEDTHNEFKSTFQYDLKEEELRRNGKISEADIRKNNHKQIRGEIQKEIALTIAAFANKEGGRLFIGINDDSSILGIGRDLKQFGNSVDKFTLSITDSLKRFLKNNAFISRLNFQFSENSDKQYMVIFTPKANEPIFVHTTNGQEVYVRMQKNSEKFSHEDFLKHCKERFPEYLK